MPARYPRNFRSKWPEFIQELGAPIPTWLESTWTKVDKLRVHSRACEDYPGPPFLLIHGLVISSLYFIPLAEHLAVHSSVHAPDLPGFGRSPAPRQSLSIPEYADFILRWMDAANIRTCHLVANSLGCQIAAHVAVMAPERLETLTLIGATIDPQAPRFSTQFIRLLRDAMREPIRLWGNWLFDFCRAGLARSIRMTRAMLRDRIEEQLPRIETPTLIICGERDPTMPANWGREAAALVPRADLVVIPQHGHCVHYTDPEAVAEHITNLAHGRIPTASL